MHLIIEIIGDDSPDADRLMKALRETVAFWGNTKTEQYTRDGTVEKTVVDIAPVGTRIGDGPITDIEFRT